MTSDEWNRHRSSVVGHRSSFVVRRSSFVVRRSSFVVRRSSVINGMNARAVAAALLEQHLRPKREERVDSGIHIALHARVGDLRVSQADLSSVGEHGRVDLILGADHNID